MKWTITQKAKSKLQEGVMHSKISWGMINERGVHCAAFLPLSVRGFLLHVSEICCMFEGPIVDRNLDPVWAQSRVYK